MAAWTAPGSNSRASPGRAVPVPSADRMGCSPAPYQGLHTHRATMKTTPSSSLLKKTGEIDKTNVYLIVGIFQNFLVDKNVIESAFRTKRVVPRICPISCQFSKIFQNFSELIRGGFIYSLPYLIKRQKGRLLPLLSVLI